MAGLFIVRSCTDPVPSAIEEKLLVVSDLHLAADGTIPPNSSMDWQNGREGDYLLVNGQYRPVLSIDPGQSQRWRILNATNARYLRLALTGHTMTLIDTDGGLLRAPVPGLDEILLAPAERIEVIVTASLSSPASAVLQSLPYLRGGMGMTGSSSTTIPLLTLKQSTAVTTAVALPSALRPLADLGMPTTSKQLVFSSGMGMGGMGGGMMSFLIDGKSFDPTRIDLTSRLYEVRDYLPQEVDRLRFITRGRELGFSLEEIRSLLTLSDDPALPCHDVDQLARQHLIDISSGCVNCAE